MARALKGALKVLPLDKIDEPKGVIRLEIDPEEVRSLAENIERVSLLQPILVRPVGERFEVVAGHRRLLAHKLLGRKDIQCCIRTISDVDCSLARASENLRRVDLSPIEEAAVYKDLHETHKLSYSEIGERMGKSEGVVKRRLDLLKMPPQLQQAVHRKQISNGVAEELSRLPDVGKIDYFLGYAIDHGVTVLVARSWVNEELKRLRTEDRDVGGGGGAANPLVSATVYVSCDLCQGPVDVMRVEHCKLCAGCFTTLVDAVKKLGES